ncbi:PREDICTED: phosphatidylcholine:diacylglycerol cholinephosphotransferase 1-like [Nelumbo nucifera]|uniref:Phosphatidylcholine:diacylglycerol cholinephosphotransferase 1-like n=1 Tax=Nelumbo nucifera TaxID=4432 RepID=A0A1U7YNL1_NELNU|nr:PREDICTED: phosphatidylcholine:diacylglycerol cholinephosphotransferase 1-like [Nelumbo nucifera]
MDAGVSRCRTDTVLRSRDRKTVNGVNGFSVGDHRSHSKTTEKSSTVAAMVGLKRKAFFMGWSMEDAVNVVRYHPIPCVFAVSLLFFMAVEYSLFMIPPSSPPFDLGFLLTRPLHRALAARPALNTALAALNTVFVGMQTTYILWAWLVEGRPRATISALFMFTCRGILGYSTQLPLPQGFLGSGVDFPVGNVSFFLFFSGHVAGSVIASLDMRRMQRRELAWLFDTLNVLQVVRLLGTRGHYTIDLAVGVGAGLLFDSLAGKYEEDSKRRIAAATHQILL